MLCVNACNFHKKFMYWKCIFALYLDIQVWYKIIESKRILRLLKSWWIIDFLIFLGLSPWQVRQGNWRLIAVGYEMSVSWHTYHRLHIICNHFLKDKISIIQTVSNSPKGGPVRTRSIKLWIWTEISKHFESLVG